MKRNTLGRVVIAVLAGYTVLAVCMTGQTQWKSLEEAIQANQEKISALTAQASTRSSTGEKSSENRLNDARMSNEIDMKQRFMELKTKLESSKNIAEQKAIIENAKTEHEKQTQIKTKAFQDALIASFSKPDKTEFNIAQQVIEIEGEMYGALEGLEKEVKTRGEKRDESRITYLESKIAELELQLAEYRQQLSAEKK